MVFSITSKNSVVSFYFALFLQQELLHTPVLGCIDFPGYKYQGGINMQKYENYQLRLTNILGNLVNCNMIKLSCFTDTYNGP